MQKFWKSVKIWQSYREFKGEPFLRHSVDTCIQDKHLWIWIYPWISTENLWIWIWIWMGNFISTASLCDTEYIWASLAAERLDDSLHCRTWFTRGVRQNWLWFLKCPGSQAACDRLETTAGTAALPVSTAECERGFSRMNLICTLDGRC